MKSLLKQLLALLFFCTPVAYASGELTPILIMDGNAGQYGFPICDGTWRYMNTTTLVNKTIVGGYLMANLVDPDSSSGADVTIWSPNYGGQGAIVNLHIFPTSVGGGRLGDRERMFPAGNGIYIANGNVQIGYACGTPTSGGHIEIYALIYVRDGTPSP